MPDPRYAHCPACAGGRPDCPRCDGEGIVEEEAPAKSPRADLSKLIGIAPDYLGGRTIDEIMDEMRRR